uniref:Uncharacterized protein n=1 Tax=Arundo donax TaxID=35708 RepID=A0A0A9ACJ7_ARUDO
MVDKNWFWKIITMYAPHILLADMATLKPVWHLFPVGNG